MKRFILIFLIVMMSNSLCGGANKQNISTSIQAKQDVNNKNAANMDKNGAMNNLDNSTSREADEAAVRKGMQEIITALDNQDQAVLSKYRGPHISQFWIEGTGLCRLAFDAPPAEGPDDINFTYNFKLDGINVATYGNAATALGYLSGNVLSSGKDVDKGPWKISVFWAKYGENWYVEHFNISKLEMPKLQYYTQLPNGYEKDNQKKWPLILFLHGTGERGNNLEKVKILEKTHSVPKYAVENKDFPFIVVSPLCPSGTSWAQIPYSLINLLDEVTEKYHIDTDRIYLTGLSMGGIGTWNLAMMYPEKFAAIAPVCGMADPQNVEKLKDIPVWAFHGQKDDRVPIEKEQILVDKLKQCGGNVKFTVYPEVGHEAWLRAYETPELYDWFLKQVKKKQ